MNGSLTLDDIKKIVEGNIKTLLAPEDSAWSQKIQLKDVDAEGNIIDGAIVEYKGLIGLRDLIAQSILDVLTFATAGGSVTANSQEASTVTVGTGSSDNNNTKVNIESDANIELKSAVGGKVDINAGNYTVDT